MTETDGNVAFHLIAARINLAGDHAELIKDIRVQQGGKLSLVVLDTLNRSLQGSESNDEDMGAYVKAADAIREAFGCAVMIVHHCGIEGTRPRGHTSLTGAADAQIAVKRICGNVVASVEFLKDGPDGPDGAKIVSRLEPVTVGVNSDGDVITSCVMVPVEDRLTDVSDNPKLTKNQQTMFSVLHEAGASGLTTEAWNERARRAGIGRKRKADLYDIRSSLKAKRLVQRIR